MFFVPGKARDYIVIKVKFMDETTQNGKNSFNVVLKLERQRNGMTQTDIASLMSVSRQTVSSWENGTRIPDVPTVEALAEVLHTSVYRLLGGKEHEETGQNTESMETLEIAKQLALLNSHYAELLWRKKQKWRFALILLGVFAAIVILILICRFYIFYYQSGNVLEVKPLQEETFIIEE